MSRDSLDKNVVSCLTGLCLEDIDYSGNIEGVHYITSILAYRGRCNDVIDVLVELSSNQLAILSIRVDYYKISFLYIEKYLVSILPDGLSDVYTLAKLNSLAGKDVSLDNKSEWVIYVY